MRHKFKFIDLFAGIGGTRLAFEAVGGECVFSCERDKFARRTYKENFAEEPQGDITNIASDEIPEHDVLVAGFPCQPFSLSGVSKKNALGRPHGFDDPTQGTLFFEIKRILAARRPSAFLLENVKNLKSHDRGNTFRVIREALSDDLGYHVQHAVLDAVAFVPQHRERIFIAGFRHEVDFEFPVFAPERRPVFRDILEDDVPEKYVLSDKLWKWFQDYAEKHRRAGHGFGFGLTSLDGCSRTLSARYYKDGSEILVPREAGNPRRLTPRECARLMGFPDDFRIVVSDTQAYKQFGNSVVSPLVRDLAEGIFGALAGERPFQGRPEYLLVRGESVAPNSAPQ